MSYLYNEGCLFIAPNADASGEEIRDQLCLSIEDPRRYLDILQVNFDLEGDPSASSVRAMRRIADAFPCTMEAHSGLLVLDEVPSYWTPSCAVYLGDIA